MKKIYYLYNQKNTEIERVEVKRIIKVSEKKLIDALMRKVISLYLKG